jgi:hypothetical protein
MAINIRTARNNFGTSESPFYAVASWSQTIDRDRFIDRMAAGRTSFSKADILGVFQLAREELASLLAEGCYVDTPLGAAMPRASGTFASRDEAFRPEAEGCDHRLRFDFRLDPWIERCALSSVRCKRDDDEDFVSPRIISFASLQSGCEGAAVAGDLLALTGSRLKLDPSDKAQGLFLIASSGTERRCDVYAENRPARLVALLPPSLEPGDYSIAIRTLSRRGRRIEGKSVGLAILSPREITIAVS